MGGGRAPLVHQQGVRLHGCCRVVQGVRVLGGLPLELALVAQGSRPTVAEEPIVPDELHFMSRVARLDAIHADSIAVRRVARLAPASGQYLSAKHVLQMQTIQFYMARK